LLPLLKELLRGTTTNLRSSLCGRLFSWRSSYGRWAIHCRSHFFTPRNPKYFQQNPTGYECGVEPIGDAWIRFGIVYYLYALMFLAFDVDVLFLFPVALAYNTVPGIRDFVEILIFVCILSLALVYAWKKGVFKWERKIYNPR